MPAAERRTRAAARGSRWVRPGAVFYRVPFISGCFAVADFLPLTCSAKALMAAESTLAAITLLLVAALAVNILA